MHRILTSLLIKVVCGPAKFFYIHVDCNVCEQYRAIKDVEHLEVHYEGLWLCLLTKALYVNKDSKQ